MRKDYYIVFGILLALIFAAIITSSPANDEESDISGEPKIPEEEIMGIILSDARTENIVSENTEKSITLIDDNLRERLSMESAICEDLPEVGPLYYVEFYYDGGSVIAIVDLESSALIRLFMKASVSM